MEYNKIIAALQLDKTSDVPLYAQVREAVLGKIKAGEIVAGEKLPPVRQLASALSVNMMTVARAYKDLTAEGVISGRGALGTFVNDVETSGEEQELVPQDARETYAGVDSDTFARMQQFGARPGVIPLTRAYPDAERVDVAAFECEIQAVLAERPSFLYSYYQPDGLPSLKESFAKVMGFERNIHLAADDLVVTSGGQQSINLVTHALLRPGDKVIVERPTYFGALDLFRSMGIVPIGIPMEADGMDITALERAVRSHSPKMIFTMPTFHNPTGITTSLEKRRAILEISRRFGVPLLEDDCCAELRYCSEPLPAIKALADPEDEVYYFSSMGKVFIPGLRLGLVAPPHHRMRSIVRQKSLADLHTAPLLQAAFDRFLRSEAYKSSLQGLRQYYGLLRTRVLGQLEQEMPHGTEWTAPDGGLNIWFRLPEGVNSIDFFYACLQRNVSILVGLHFFSDQPDERSVRLSFGLSNEEQVLNAVKSMAAAAKALQTRSVSRFPVLV